MIASLLALLSGPRFDPEAIAQALGGRWATDPTASTPHRQERVLQAALPAGLSGRTAAARAWAVVSFRVDPAALLIPEAQALALFSRPPDAFSVQHAGTTYGPEIRWVEHRFEVPAGALAALRRGGAPPGGARPEPRRRR